MEQNKQTIDELTEAFHSYLRSIRRSENTIRLYLTAWDRLKDYMAEQGVKIYTGKIGEAFLVAELGKYNYENLNSTQQNFVSKIEALIDFQNTGKILLGTRRKPPKELNGPIGKSMKDFIDFKTTIYSLSKNTITNYTIYLHAFNCFLSERQIRSEHRITISEILQFIGELILRRPRQDM